MAFSAIFSNKSLYLILSRGYAIVVWLILDQLEAKWWFRIRRKSPNPCRHRRFVYPTFIKSANSFSANNNHANSIDDYGIHGTWTSSHSSSSENNNFSSSAEYVISLYSFSYQAIQRPPSAIPITSFPVASFNTC